MNRQEYLIRTDYRNTTLLNDISMYCGGFENLKKLHADEIRWRIDIKTFHQRNKYAIIERLNRIALRDDICLMELLENETNYTQDGLWRMFLFDDELSRTFSGEIEEIIFNIVVKDIKNEIDTLQKEEDERNDYAEISQGNSQELES